MSAVRNDLRDAFDPCRKRLGAFRKPLLYPSELRGHGRSKITHRDIATQGGAVEVYRREPETAWRAVASVDPDGAGLIRYIDRGVMAGNRYGYRVGVTGPAGEQFLAETWITVPALAALAFEGVQPNPSDRNVECRSRSPARSRLAWSSSTSRAA